MNRRLHIQVILFAVASAACGESGQTLRGEDSTSTDSGIPLPDARTSPNPVDAAPADAASLDASRDAARADATRPDVGPSNQSGNFRAFPNCPDRSDYASGNQVSVSGRTYAPACLRIARGQTVTIEASPAHPLKGGLSAPYGSPIPGSESVIQVVGTRNFTFDEPGFYPFYCVNHGDPNGNGMAGVVWVE